MLEAGTRDGGEIVERQLIGCAYKNEHCHHAVAGNRVSAIALGDVGIVRSLQFSRCKRGVECPLDGKQLCHCTLHPFRGNNHRLNIGFVGSAGEPFFLFHQWRAVLS